MLFRSAILHHVSGATGDAPVTPQPASYARWSKDISHYPWVDLEHSLYRPTTAAEDVDDYEDEDEDEDDAADGDEDEESSHSKDDGAS